jgi:hypothetical protein
MKKYLAVGVLTMILLLDCKSNSLIILFTQVQKIKFKEIPIKSILINREVPNSELLVLEGNGIFVIQISSKESDALEKANPDEYESYSENANNEAENVNSLTSKMKIKSYWSDKRYLKINNQIIKYLLDTRAIHLAGEYCILFKSENEPKIVLLEEVTESRLKDYFKK